MVTYSWTTVSGPTANQLRRTVGANTRIIARDISALNVTESASAIAVNVTAAVVTNEGRTINYQLLGKLAKR